MLDRRDLFDRLPASLSAPRARVLAAAVVVGTAAACGGPGPSAASSDAGSVTAQAPSTGSPPSGARSSAETAPSFAGCPVLPADSPWNRDVSADPVDAASDALIAAMSPDATLGLALGTTEQYWGARYVVVPPEQPLVPIEYGTGGEDYADQSDHGPFPIPLDVPIQGGSDADPDPSSGDRHVIVVQSGTCHLFELYNTERIAGGFRVSSSAWFDLRSNPRRPRGWTSADGAGLPIFPGLLRWDEIAAGQIRHALRFTIPRARDAFVEPANHCGPEADASLPPYGLRVRLKASFDVTPYAPTTRVLLEALKRYGLILGDQGAAWQVSGASDPGLGEALQDLRSRPIPGSAFEVPQMGAVQGC